MTQITSETTSIGLWGFPVFPGTFIFLVHSFPLYRSINKNIWADVYLRGKTTVLQTSLRDTHICHLKFKSTYIIMETNCIYWPHIGLALCPRLKIDPRLLKIPRLCCALVVHICFLRFSFVLPSKPGYSLSYFTL